MLAVEGQCPSGYPHSMYCTTCTMTSKWLQIFLFHTSHTRVHMKLDKYSVVHALNSNSQINTIRIKRTFEIQCTPLNSKSINNFKNFEFTQVIMIYR